MSENPYQPPDDARELGQQQSEPPSEAPAGHPLAFVAMIALFLLIYGALIVAVMFIVLLFGGLVPA
jgi:hypothetical protein